MESETVGKWDSILDGFFDWFMVIFLVTVLSLVCASDMPEGMKTFMTLDVTFLVLCATPDVHVLG